MQYCSSLKSKLIIVVLFGSHVDSKTIEKQFFTLSSYRLISDRGEGGGVEYIHSILICENNRNSKITYCSFEDMGIFVINS